MRGKFDLVNFKHVYLHLNKTMLLRSLLKKTPFKALWVFYTLKKIDESRIRNKFQLSPSIKIRISDASDRGYLIFLMKFASMRLTSLI